MQKSQQKLVVVNRTRMALPSFPFKALKQAALGVRYQLELSFVNEAESRAINIRYCTKRKAANVLSFSYSPRRGQIIICPTKARRESRFYGYSPATFLKYLFIHGLLHLKGYRHGSTMEAEEKRLYTRFSGT